jgi:Flp pilus assembly pilin Flp
MPELSGRMLAFIDRTAWRIQERAGQAMIEYALIISLVVIIILITLVLLGNTVRKTYCNIGVAVGSA